MAHLRPALPQWRLSGHAVMPAGSNMKSLYISLGFCPRRTSWWAADVGKHTTGMYVVVLHLCAHVFPHDARLTTRCGCVKEQRAEAAGMHSTSVPTLMHWACHAHAVVALVHICPSKLLALFTCSSNSPDAAKSASSSARGGSNHARP